jgi:integrase
VGSIQPYETAGGRRYRVRYRKPDHTQTDRRGFRTKREAEVFLASVTVSMTRGEWIDPSNSRITVREWGEQWFTAQVQVKPATRSGYRYNLDHHIYPVWGERRLVGIGHAEVQDWVGELSERLKPSTVKQIYLLLSGLMKFAIRDGRLVRNPCEFIRLPRIERKRKGYLTADQVAHVASFCGPNADLVVFLSFTGLRWGEMAALRVGSVDFDRRRVAVDESVVELEGVMTWGTPKNHERRSVPFPDFLAGPLAARCASRSLDAPLFTSANGGLIRNGNFRHRVFEPAVRQSMEEDPGFPWVTPHDLRHTAASLAISAGANVKAVQRLLGHASAAMTLDVYAELFEDDLDAVAAALTHRVGGSRVGKMWAEPKTAALTNQKGPVKTGPDLGI